jgi:hypothetical protein
MTFVYVSGTGTDSTERGRTMWARVKGRTENALLRLPFKAVYMLRPGVIVPMHGVRSKTRLYRIFYTVLGPVLPALHELFPRSVISTEQLGRAMLRLARSGYSKRCAGDGRHRSAVITLESRASSRRGDVDHCAVSCITFLWHALPVGPPWAMAVFV